MITPNPQLLKLLQQRAQGQQGGAPIQAPGVPQTPAPQNAGQPQPPQVPTAQPQGQSPSAQSAPQTPVDDETKDAIKVLLMKAIKLL